MRFEQGVKATKNRKPARAFLYPAILFVLFFCGSSSGLPAQQDPIVSAQANLVAALKGEREIIEVDCSGYRNTGGPGKYRQAIPYVNCSMEHFRVATLQWSKANNEILAMAQGTIQTLHLQQMPAGDIQQQTKTNMANGAGYAHNLLRGWYQRIAKLDEDLLAAGFLSQANAQQILERVNESLARTTKVAQGYVAAVRDSSSLTNDSLRTLTEKLHNDMFQPAKELLTYLQQTLFSEKDRNIRHFERMLERDSESFEVIMKQYIEMLDKTFGAMQEHAKTTWVQMQDAG